MSRGNELLARSGRQATAYLPPQWPIRELTDAAGTAPLWRGPQKPMSQATLADRRKPLVSIIIPFLNAEKFIRDAIDSVLPQTYDNWELLLVDDGSTDTSTEITRRCAAQHPVKVRYLEHSGHQNRGACASRNLGI